MKVKKKLNIFDRILLFITFLLCFSLLLTYLASVVNPATYWVFAFFGLAYPPLLLATLIMIVYWLLRKSIWVLLPVLVILGGWSTLNKNIGLRFKANLPIARDSNTVRVMTYNVHNFKRYGAKNDVSTKHDILQIIADKSPDIIGIQEFYTRRHGQYDMIDSISKILGSGDHYFQAMESSNSEQIGMAIFSKYPIVAHGFIGLSPDKTSGNQCLYADIKKGNKTIRVYSMHLQSICFDPDDYRYLDGLSKAGKPSIGSTKKLGSKLKIAFIKRSVQVTKIKQDAASCPYPYIISGDFNDTPSSYVVSEMGKGLKNTFYEKGSGLGRTYNGDFPNYQIDYIMASPAFEVRNYEIIEKRLSDHYPVCSDLLLK